MYRSVARREHAGRTVLEHHAREHGHTGEAEWRERISAGRVLVGGSPCDPGRVLREGDTLEWHRPPWQEPEPPAGLRVLLEDDHLLALDKPAGLQVLPAGNLLACTLLHVVRGADPARAAWSPVHRLGRGTSGIVLLGKTEAARASLSAQLRVHAVGKLYLGVVSGELPLSFRATWRIGREGSGLGARHACLPDGKVALTRVRVLRRHDATRRGLVAAEPVTGRADQIRIHLAKAGAPLSGDPLFLAGGRLSSARSGDCGYRLHASALRFRHPATGRVVKLRCAPSWLDAWWDDGLTPA